MINYAIGTFLVAAVGGLVMAVQIFKERVPSVPLAVLHGALGATGLALLLWVFLTSEPALAVTVGLVILVVAALGGFFLASFHLRGIPHPKAVVVIHAGAALVGVTALLVTFL